MLNFRILLVSTLLVCVFSKKALFCRIEQSAQDKTSIVVDMDKIIEDTKESSESKIDVKKENEKKDGERIVIDKIVARVNGVNLLASTLATAQISKEGKCFTLDELIVDELLYQRAAEKQMLSSSTEVDSHLTAFKIQNGFDKMSDEEFEQQLGSSGFTLKTYKAQLARYISTEKIKHAEFSEKVVVTWQEVKDYYDKHPEHTKEERKLAICTINQEQDVESIDWKNDSSLKWDDLGWVAVSSIDKIFESAKTLAKGEVSKPIKDGKLVKIIKVVDIKPSVLETFDKRYSRIERHLQNKSKEAFLKTFEKDLKKEADIVIL